MKPSKLRDRSHGDKLEDSQSAVVWNKAMALVVSCLLGGGVAGLLSISDGLRWTAMGFMYILYHNHNLPVCNLVPGRAVPIHRAPSTPTLEFLADYYKI